MSDLMLDVDQAGELKAAFRRGGWTKAEIKKASEGDLLSHQFLAVLRGAAKIVPVPILTKVTTFTSPGRTEKFGVSHYFKTKTTTTDRPKIRVGEEFTKAFGETSEDPRSASLYALYRVGRSISKGEELSEVGEFICTPLSVIWQMILIQEYGWDAFFEKNKSISFLAMNADGKSSRVYVGFGPDYGGDWFINCGPYTGCWFAGDLLVFPD